MTFAESMALQKAKQMALEQAGTYVESYAKVQNYQLTVDEIQTIAGGVLQVEILDKTRTLVGDGLKFFVKIKATVSTDKVAELAQHIKGKNVGEEYKKLQDQYAELTQEIEIWKQLIAKTPPGADRDRALDQIREREKEFATIQRDEAAFFHRMIAGEALVTKALNEERERVANLRSIQKEIDDLFKFILQGQSVTIGEPTVSVVSNTKDFKIVVPVTLRASQLPLALERTPKKIEVLIRRHSKSVVSQRYSNKISCLSKMWLVSSITACASS